MAKKSIHQYALELQVNQNVDSLLSLLPITNENKEQLLGRIRELRNLCSKGPNVQHILVTHTNFITFIQLFLRDDSHNLDRVRLLLWQLLGNAIVNNETTQKKVWSDFGNLIESKCIHPLGKSTNVQLMILYNIFIGKSGSVSDDIVLRLATKLWHNINEQKCNESFYYLHLIYEHLIVNNRSIVRLYSQLEMDERMAFLNYISSYLQNDSPNGLIESFLLRHISKEFKITSDCILRHSATGVEGMRPQVVYSLLKIIAKASGDERYSNIYFEDHSLFLNISSLLRCIVELGKHVEKNVFTPLNKLEEVAPSSNSEYNFENEITFELKTLLIRSIANMLYKNKPNVDYCLDIQLIPTLLECTTMDARNPLMQEWSILALRNACIESKQIQDVIADLTYRGMAKNDILNDLNLELGSLRIQSKEK